MAVGSISNTHGVPGLQHASQLKTVSDVFDLRKKFIGNIEKASLPTTTEEERKRLLSFVICGGGPTGVEFASEISDVLKEDVAERASRCFL
jgi:NADH:ubiquinone reductase (H+-translocating)